METPLTTGLRNMLRSGNIPALLETVQYPSPAIYRLFFSCLRVLNTPLSHDRGTHSEATATTLEELPQGKTVNTCSAKDFVFVLHIPTLLSIPNWCH